MRLDSTQETTAARYLAGVDKQELVRVLRDYGDVRPAKRIADAIVHRRDRGQMNLTSDLADAVSEALDFVHGQPEETRTVFQAIRIAVNDELASLETCLKSAVDALAPEGRLVVLTFHSGEDRIAKNVLRDAARVHRELHPDGRVKHAVPPRVKLLTRKPILPDEEEVRRNPRAHSAKLRAAERIDEGAKP